jgi:hypothetical protein
MLRIRTVSRPYRLIDLAVFVFALFWGSAAVAIFVLVEGDLVRVGLIAMGLPVFVTLLWVAGKRVIGKVQCRECSRPLPSPLENSGVDGEPVLYHCPNCDILWFAGITSSS